MADNEENLDWTAEVDKDQLPRLFAKYNINTPERRSVAVENMDRWIDSLVDLESAGSGNVMNVSKNSKASGYTQVIPGTKDLIVSQMSQSKSPAVRALGKKVASAKYFMDLPKDEQLAASRFHMYQKKGSDPYINRVFDGDPGFDLYERFWHTVPTKRLRERGLQFLKPGKKMPTYTRGGSQLIRVGPVGVPMIVDKLASGGPVADPRGIAALGRGRDTELVHMTPSEVGGLQQLAESLGGSLTINPNTGLPEAGFLEDGGPTILGLAMAPMTGGLSLAQSAMLAGATGVTAGAVTGDWKQGLRWGMGVAGGQSMGSSLMGAAPGAVTSAGTTIPSVANTAAVVPPVEPVTTFGQGFATESGLDKSLLGIKDFSLGPGAKTLEIPTLFDAPLSDAVKAAAQAPGVTTVPFDAPIANPLSVQISSAPTSVPMYAPGDIAKRFDPDVLGQGYSQMYEGLTAPDMAGIKALGMKAPLAAFGSIGLNAYEDDWEPEEYKRKKVEGEMEYPKGGFTAPTRTFATSLGPSDSREDLMFQPNPFVGIGYRPYYGAGGGIIDLERYQEGGAVNTQTTPAAPAPLYKESFPSYAETTPTYAQSFPSYETSGGIPSLGAGSFGETDYFPQDRAAQAKQDAANQFHRNWMLRDSTDYFQHFNPWTGDPLPAGIARMEEFGYGMPYYETKVRMAEGGLTKGPGDGMSDEIMTTISGVRPAALSPGEFVVPADVVSGVGNGDTNAGAKRLYAMMDRVRKSRTGKTSQPKEIKAGGMLPA